MEVPADFWVLFIANLPVVVVLFFALQKGYIVMGITHNKRIEDKEEEIRFREELRKEALADRAIVLERDKEKTETLRELTDVVKQTLALNDRLLNDNLENRWDGNDRRTETPKRVR